MFDLHTHSTASDGALTPEALVEHAAAHGFDTIALTDHDTVAGIAPAVAHGVKQGVDVIPGLELEAKWNGAGQMHILGYFVEPDNLALLESLHWLRERRRERGEEIAARLARLNAPICWARVEELADGGSVGRPHIARALVDAGHVRDISEAFARFLKNGGPAYIDKVQFTSEQAIDLIRRAGGVAVLAHPATLKLPLPAFEDILDELVRQGLDGVEVYWSKHDACEIGFYRQCAAARSLVVTGGSDFHGSTKPGVEMGMHLRYMNGDSDLVAGLRQFHSKSRLPATGQVVG